VQARPYVGPKWTWMEAIKRGYDNCYLTKHLALNSVEG